MHCFPLPGTPGRHPIGVAPVPVADHEPLTLPIRFTDGATWLPIALPKWLPFTLPKSSWSDVSAATA